jgi:isochorismate pyruvate lyase
MLRDKAAQRLNFHVLPLSTHLTHSIEMKTEHHMEPGACSGMEDIRREIDHIDRAVISMLGKRFKYVIAASRFKTSETAVRAPERFKAMLEKRREWAQSEGLNPHAIEKMYSDLVNHFIEEEMKRWKSHQPNA